MGNELDARIERIFGFNKPADRCLSDLRLFLLECGSGGSVSLRSDNVSSIFRLLAALNRSESIRERQDEISKLMRSLARFVGLFVDYFDGPALLDILVSCGELDCFDTGVLEPVAEAIAASKSSFSGQMCASAMQSCAHLRWPHERLLAALASRVTEAAGNLSPGHLAMVAEACGTLVYGRRQLFVAIERETTARLEHFRGGALLQVILCFAVLNFKALDLPRWLFSPALLDLSPMLSRNLAMAVHFFGLSLPDAVRQKIEASDRVRKRDEDPGSKSLKLFLGENKPCFKPGVQIAGLWVDGFVQDDGRNYVYQLMPETAFLRQTPPEQVAGLWLLREIVLREAGYQTVRIPREKWRRCADDNQRSKVLIEAELRL